MRPATVILGVIFLSALVGSVAANDTGENLVAVIQAEAGRPADPQPTERLDLRDVPIPTRLFYMVGSDNAEVVRSVADVNGDQLEDIIVGIDESQEPNVFCIDGASQNVATVLWSFQPTDGASGGATWGEQAIEVISDSDKNGYSNILVGTAWGGRTAYNLDSQLGVVVWKFDTYLEPDSGWVYSMAELNDITGDGVPECAFGAGSFNDTAYLIDGASVGGQATVLWRWAAADGVVSVRDLGDVNGDGKHDPIFAVGDYGEAVVCIDGGSPGPNATVVWEYDADASVWSLGVLPDITDDGVDEALAVTWAANGNAIRAVNGATGIEIWATTEVFGGGYSAQIMPDINGDGHPEVIAGAKENAVTLLDGTDGTVIWKTPVGTANYGWVPSARATGDMNGDGVPDVVAASWDTYVYGMDGKYGHILWAFPTSNRVFSVHPVGDLTGDGVPDVVAGTQNTVNNIVVHVLDGGAAWPALFEDGFESGDTTAWSVTVP